MKKSDIIYVAGHTGMVGSAIIRELQKEGYTNIITQTSSKLNLINQEEVNRFFKYIRPKYVFMAAAKVGGIIANRDNKVDFLYQNMMIQNNIIKASADYGVNKLLFLGSSCIYPKNCPIPIKEEYLMTGELEKSNNAYALAKIAGLELCKAYHEQEGKNFISCMPTNLYGTGDNYDLNTSHVIPALIRKFHEAKLNNDPTVSVWGTGNVYREFMIVDDLAKACIFLMNNYNDSEHINVGSGIELSISDLAALISSIVGYTGKTVYDETKPDGTYRKLLDSSKLNKLRWKPEIGLEEGLKKVYVEYKSIN